MPWNRTFLCLILPSRPVLQCLFDVLQCKTCRRIACRHTNVHTGNRHTFKSS